MHAGPPPRKKFIAWDWNGTLLDDTDAVLDCVNIVLSKMNKPAIGIELFRNTQIRPLEKFYLAIGLTPEEAPTALENERSIFHDNYEPMADLAPLRAGAVDLLQNLQKQGVANIIVSNHLVDQIARILKLRAIHHHFDEVLAYANRGTQFRDMTKGEKLHQYMGSKGLNPADAIIIGDTLEEIEIARAYGMISIAITGGIHSEQRLCALNPDHIVHSLHELTPILQERGFIS